MQSTPCEMRHLRSDYQHVNDTGSLTFQQLLDGIFDQSSSDAIRREISRANSLHRASPVRPTLQRLFDEGFENVEGFQVKIGEETQHIPSTGPNFRKEKTPFWHSGVSDAHLSRNSTRDAVALSWFVPIRILNSATQKFKQNETASKLRYGMII
jgi:hypothetical protein